MGYVVKNPSESVLLKESSAYHLQGGHAQLCRLRGHTNGDRKVFEDKERSVRPAGSGPQMCRIFSAKASLCTG